MEITFTDKEIDMLKSAGSNIGSVLNSIAGKDLKEKVLVFTSFLPNEAFLIQRVWHIVNGIYDTIKCKECKTGATKWSYDDKEYRKFCCIKCSRKQSVISAKKTCIEKYGVDNPLKVKEIKEKVSATMEERYGSKWYCSTDVCQQASKNFQADHKDDIITKRESTCLSKFGHIHPTTTDEIRIKSIESNTRKYGVPYSSQNSDTRELARNTSIERYGVPYAVQNAEIHDKNIRNGHKYKNYTLPSGKIIQIQGWENKALDILLKTYDETELITKRIDMPTIWYRKNNRKHRYYPDIYIQKENKIIEVKSTWTYSNALEINILKQEACKRLGYNFEFMIL